MTRLLSRVNILFRSRLVDDLGDDGGVGLTGVEHSHASIMFLTANISGRTQRWTSSSVSARRRPAVTEGR